MRLQTPSSRLLAQALAKAQKCIASKNSVAILASALLDKKGNKFFFTTSTGDAQLTIPAPLSQISDTFDGPVALPVDIISAFLGTLPDCVVTLNFIDDHTLNMEYCTTVGNSTKAGKVQVTYSSGNEFPKMNAPQTDSLHITLPMSAFSSAVSKASVFVSKIELRPTMSCLCLDVAEDMSDVKFVATDGHSLYKHTHSNNPKAGGSDFYRSGRPDAILIHMQNFRALSAFDDCEQVDIESDGTTIRITSGNTEYICKRIEGRYPNYTSVIPKGNPYFVCFDKKEMLAVLKRVAVFGDSSSNLIELSLDGMFINISAKNADFGRSAEDQVTLLNSECQQGFRIGFNVKTLTECISALHGDTLRMQLSDPQRAAVITEDSPSAASLTMCMPMVI